MELLCDGQWRTQDFFFSREVFYNEMQEPWKSRWAGGGDYSRHEVGVSSYITNLSHKQASKKVNGGGGGEIVFGDPKRFLNPLTPPAYALEFLSK